MPLSLKRGDYYQARPRGAQRHSRCGQVGEAKFSCSRERGHLGPHVACGLTIDAETELSALICDPWGSEDEMGLWPVGQRMQVRLDGDVVCAAPNGRGQNCSRPEGHAGVHVGCGNGVRETSINAVWADLRNEPSSFWHQPAPQGYPGAPVNAIMTTADVPPATPQKGGDDKMAKKYVFFGAVLHHKPVAGATPAVTDTETTYAVEPRYILAAGAIAASTELARAIPAGLDSSELEIVTQRLPL